MPEFDVTGEWIMRGIKRVEADSVEDAEQKAFEDGQLPEGEFAKGTFEVINVEKV